MSAERWLPIPGWEGYYEVSDMGRVKAVQRKVNGYGGRVHTRQERLLAASPNEGGYPEVRLSRDGKPKGLKVHRLVLLAFVGPCPDGYEACHGDGDPGNANLSNLRWDSRSANTLDAVSHGTHPMASRTHCKRGHPFDAANTYRPPGYARRCCRACMRERRVEQRRAAA